MSEINSTAEQILILESVHYLKPVARNSSERIEAYNETINNIGIVEVALSILIFGYLFYS